MYVPQQAAVAASNILFNESKIFTLEGGCCPALLSMRNVKGLVDVSAESTVAANGLLTAISFALYNGVEWQFAPTGITTGHNRQCLF